MWPDICCIYDLDIRNDIACARMAFGFECVGGVGIPRWKLHMAEHHVIKHSEVRCLPCQDFSSHGSPVADMTATVRFWFDVKLRGRVRH